MIMKLKFVLVYLLSLYGITLFSQTHSTSVTLNMEGALKIATQAVQIAKQSGKNVSIAVLDASGTTLLLLKGDHVGPHNTEASRRKAYTAVSTKTPTWDLMKKAASDETSRNLNTLPELLLLGGGVPVWTDGKLIGSIGISGGGGGEVDHNIARTAIMNSGYQVVQ